MKNELFEEKNMKFRKKLALCGGGGMGDAASLKYAVNFLIAQIHKMNL